MLLLQGDIRLQSGVKLCQFGFRCRTQNRILAAEHRRKFGALFGQLPSRRCSRLCFTGQKRGIRRGHGDVGKADAVDHAAQAGHIASGHAQRIGKPIGRAGGSVQMPGDRRAVLADVASLNGGIHHLGLKPASRIDSSDNPRGQPALWRDKLSTDGLFQRVAKLLRLIDGTRQPPGLRSGNSQSLHGLPCFQHLSRHVGRGDGTHLQVAIDHLQGVGLLLKRLGIAEFVNRGLKGKKLIFCQPHFIGNILGCALAGNLEQVDRRCRNFVFVGNHCDSISRCLVCCFDFSRAQSGEQFQDLPIDLAILLRNFGQ